MVSRRRREAGQALLMVTLVLLLLMLGIAMVDDALAARLRATRDESLRVELDALADAAMAEALANLAAGSSYPGAPAHPFARGVISSRVVWLGETRYEVSASGWLGARLRALRAEVDMPWGRPIVRSWRVLPAATIIESGR
jgi:hypothetical protein